MKNTQKNKQEIDKAGYERFGRYMAAVYESGYIDKKRLYIASFVRGVFQGFGGVLGATILVTLLAWSLSFFNELPVIGRFIDRVQQTVNTSEE